MIMKPLYIKALLLTAILSLACTTKVSEWVLLNAFPDRYLLVYYHKTPLSESIKVQNRDLTEKFKSANIQLRTLQKEDISAPHYALYYNNRLFSEYADSKELGDMVFSPLRNKIASELMSGKLCVMLYLKSGNKEKDEKGIQVIRQTIAVSPFGEIIPVIELDRDNDEEKHFISMLLNVESDLIDINEPMLFGVFGRLRVLEPLLAKGISSENINLMIDFLTADCSCVIKDDLPGINILYVGTWDNPLPAMVNRILDENPLLVHH
jgi:hypothetical protein